MLSTIFIWFASSFGFVDGKFGMVEMSDSILAVIGNAMAFIFAPLGFGTWEAAVATVTGLIAKENVVGTFGVLFGFAEVAEDGMEIWSNLQTMLSPLAGYSFLVFNLLCAPCFAAIGAIKREMNNSKWTWFAILYQCGLAYIASLIIFQIGSLFAGNANPIGVTAAFIALAFMVYMVARRSVNDIKSKRTLKM